MTVASGEPQESGDDYRSTFKRLDVDDVHVIDTAEPEDANNPDAIDFIKRATGVFLTGGAQERICRKLKDSEIEKLLHQRYQEPNFVIGGTSAGAHAMSDQMITEGPSQTNPRYQSGTILPGLGFLQKVLIDSHFEQRGRFGRLLSALTMQPHYWGLGIDENTAVVVNQGKHFKVIGENAVTIMDVSETSHSKTQKLSHEESLVLWGIKMHILPDGYSFEVENQKPVLKEVPSEEGLVKS